MDHLLMIRIYQIMFNQDHIGHHKLFLDADIIKR